MIIYIGIAKQLLLLWLIKIGNALLYYDEVQYAISKKHKEIKNVDSLLEKRTSFYKKYGIGLFDSFTGKNNLSLPELLCRS